VNPSVRRSWGSSRFRGRMRPIPAGTDVRLGDSSDQRELLAARRAFPAVGVCRGAGPGHAHAPR